MIKFFLLFVLMIFGIVFLLGGLTVFKVLRRIQDIKQQFNNAGRQGQQGHRKANGNNANSSYGNNAYGNNAYGNSSYNAEGISDSRSHADRNKKIIPKDEGEYVDFVEEK